MAKDFTDERGSERIVLNRCSIRGSGIGRSRVGRSSVGSMARSGDWPTTISGHRAPLLATERYFPFPAVAISAMDGFR